MGGNSSKDMSTTDILNEFTTSVVTNVLNEKKTTISGVQTMNISCDQDVYEKAIELCSKAVQEAQATKAAVLLAAMQKGTEPSTALMQSLDKKPIACEACSAETASQLSVISVSMNDITDNSIASKIQTELLSKLDAAKTTLQNEGFSKNDVLDQSMTTIRNKISSDITTSIVNSSLTSFVTNQDIKLKNVSAKNLSQSSVVNFISASLVENIVNGDSTVKAAVENILTKENTQKSIASNTTDTANKLIDTVGGVANNALGQLGKMFGNVMVVYIVFIIIGGFVLYRILTGGISPEAQQMIGNFSQQFAPQGYAPQAFAPRPYAPQPPANPQFGPFLENEYSTPSGPSGFRSMMSGIKKPNFLSNMKRPDFSALSNNAKNMFGNIKFDSLKNLANSKNFAKLGSVMSKLK